MRRRWRPEKNPEPARTPLQQELQRCLDDLNAFGFLSDARSHVPSGVLCFGPRDVYGEHWAGAVIWLRPGGYHGYKTLTLVGVWARAENEELQIIVGTLRRKFTAPFYNPEAYFHNIRRSFDLYYSDAITLPEESSRLYETRYNPSRRLAIRSEIEAVLDNYMRGV